MGANFQQLTGIQGQGLQGTPGVQISQAQVPDFEQSYDRLAGTIVESVRQMKGTERILEYTKIKTETAALDKEYEMVTPTLSSRGTVINPEGEEVDYKDYVQNYTSRKQQLLQNFDTQYNTPALFRNDQLWAASKTELQALPRQQQLNILALERNRLELKVAEDVATISVNTAMPLKDRLVSMDVALNKAPTTDANKVRIKLQAAGNAIEASFRGFQETVAQGQQEIVNLYSEDEQELAEKLLEYRRSDEYNKALQSLFNDMDVAREYDARLDNDIEALKTRVTLQESQELTKDTLAVGRYKQQAMEMQRRVLAQQTDPMMEIAFKNPNDPLLPQFYANVQASLKNATDADKIFLNAQVDLVKSMQQAAKSGDGTYLSIDASKIKNPQTKAYVLRRQEMEQQQLSAQAEREQKRQIAAYERMTDMELKVDAILESKGFLTNEQQRRFAGEIGTGKLNELMQHHNALPVSQDTLSNALIGQANPAQVLQKLGVSNVPGGTGERVLKDVAKEAYAISQTDVNAAFNMAQTPYEAMELSFALGNYGKNISVKPFGNAVQIQYGNQNKQIPLIDLVNNRMGLSNTQVYRLFAAHELSKNPKLDIDQLGTQVEARVKQFNQGILSMEKKRATDSRTFNPAKIVPFNTKTRNVAVRFSGSSNMNYQNAGTVALIRGIDKEFGALGLRNSGLTITSEFRGAKGYVPRGGGTFHQDPTGVAIDAVSFSKDPGILGKQFYGLMLALSKSVKSDDYEIAGVSHQGQQPLFDIAKAVRNTGTMPANYAKLLSPNQIRFVSQMVRNSTFIEEKKNSQSHLHISGKANKAGTYEYYSQR